MSNPEVPTRRPFLTGRKVVASMFLMGICATAFLYGYWTLHLMPFMPLQEAIVAEFPGSAPRVNGGTSPLISSAWILVNTLADVSRVIGSCNGIVFGSESDRGNTASETGVDA